MEANVVLSRASVPRVGVHRQDEQVARPQCLLPARACWWAVRQLRREHASVLGLARQLGKSWKKVWRSIRPLLKAMDADPAPFAGVNIRGVDDQIWHQVSPVKRGSKELTGMVHRTRYEEGNTRATLLDLVPGRSRGVPALAAGTRRGVPSGHDDRDTGPVSGLP